MKNQSLNAIIRAQTPPEILSEIATIPMQHVAIGWEYEEHPPHQIAQLWVLDFRRCLEPACAEYRIWNRTHLFTAGACNVDWGVNPRATPLGKVAEFVVDGELPPGKKLLEILREFAKIEGCDWARHMIAALHSGHFYVHGEHYWL